MDSKNIHIQICTGTACFVLGGADLLLLKEELHALWSPQGISREDIDQSVHLTGSTCIERCRNSQERPPFVTINGETYGEATIQKIADIIYPRLFPDGPMLKQE